MSERLEEIRHTLEVPFGYACKGQMPMAEFITLKPPTARNRNECAILEQAFMRALPDTSEFTDEQKDNAKDKSSEESSMPTGAEALAMIAMSRDSELAEVMEVSRKLFLNGVALIDGETKLTGPSLDNISMDDFKEMVGKYLVGFILRSTLEKQGTS